MALLLDMARRAHPRMAGVRKLLVASRVLARLAQEEP
jgi:hypothetical protein